MFNAVFSILFSIWFGAALIAAAIFPFWFISKVLL